MLLKPHLPEARLRDEILDILVRGAEHWTRGPHHLDEIEATVPSQFQRLRSAQQTLAQSLDDTQTIGGHELPMLRPPDSTLSTEVSEHPSYYQKRGAHKSHIVDRELGGEQRMQC